MSKEYWEKVLGQKFDEPEIIDGKKKYKPGTGVNHEFKSTELAPMTDEEQMNLDPMGKYLNAAAIGIQEKIERSIRGKE